MRNHTPLSPEEFHAFCCEVLSRVGTYRYVIDSGSNQAAAEVLPVSAQRVGQIVKDLKGALAPWSDDQPITNPRYKKAVPSEAGQLLYDFASDVAVRSDAFLAELVKLQHSHEVRVATIHSAWKAHGAVLTALLKKRIPDATISETIITGNRYAEKIEKEVREGRADVGITSFPGKVALPLVLDPLKDRELRLVLSASYPKLPKEPVVTIGQMLGNDPALKFVTHPRGLDGPLARIVLSYLKKIDADWGPGQKIEAPKIEEIKKRLEYIPRTMALLPRDSVAKEVKAGTLVSYRLDPMPPPFTWGIIYRPVSSRRAVREFISCFDRYKP